MAGNLTTGLDEQARDPAAGHEADRAGDVVWVPAARMMGPTASRHLGVERHAARRGRRARLTTRWAPDAPTAGRYQDETGPAQLTGMPTERQAVRRAGRELAAATDGPILRGYRWVSTVWLATLVDEHGDAVLACGVLDHAVSDGAAAGLAGTYRWVALPSPRPTLDAGDLRVVRDWLDAHERRLVPAGDSPGRTGAAAGPPADHRSDARRERHPAGLTAREVEVLRLVAEGLTDRKVAERLFVSPRTVNTHLASIYGKLGVGSRAAATRFAVEQRLV